MQPSSRPVIYADIRAPVRNLMQVLCDVQKCKTRRWLWFVVVVAAAAVTALLWCLWFQHADGGRRWTEALEWVWRSCVRRMTWPPAWCWTLCWASAPTKWTSGNLTHNTAIMESSDYPVLWYGWKECDHCCFAGFCKAWFLRFLVGWKKYKGWRKQLI